MQQGVISRKLAKGGKAEEEEEEEPDVGEIVEEPVDEES